MVKKETIEKYKKYIGKDFGCIHVDDIDLSEINKNRIYFFCTCKQCGRKIRLRNDNIRPNAVGCTHCMGIWRKKHFEELEKQKSIPKDIRLKWNHFKNNAELRGINFDLTKEQVLDLCNKPCFYCGKKDALVSIEWIILKDIQQIIAYRVVDAATK